MTRIVPFMVFTIKKLDVFIVVYVKTDTEGHSKSFNIHNFTFKIEAAVSQIFYKIGVIKSFAKLQNNRPLACNATLLKKILRHRCFHVNFGKLYEKPFSIEHL